MVGVLAVSITPEAQWWMGKRSIFERHTGHAVYSFLVLDYHAGINAEERGKRYINFSTVDVALTASLDRPTKLAGTPALMSSFSNFMS